MSERAKKLSSRESKLAAGMTSVRTGGVHRRTRPVVDTDTDIATSVGVLTTPALVVVEDVEEIETPAAPRARKTVAPQGGTALLDALCAERRAGVSGRTFVTSNIKAPGSVRLRIDAVTRAAVTADLKYASGINMTALVETAMQNVAAKPTRYVPRAIEIAAEPGKIAFNTKVETNTSRQALAAWQLLPSDARPASHGPLIAAAIEELVAALEQAVGISSE